MRIGHSQVYRCTGKIEWIELARLGFQAFELGYLRRWVWVEDVASDRA